MKLKKITRNVMQATRAFSACRVSAIQASFALGKLALALAGYKWIKVKAKKGSRHGTWCIVRVK